MPSLNLDLDYFTNPKIIRLVGLLGAEGFTIPIRLWCYVAKHHAVTGKLAGYSKQEIEQIVGWHGDQGRCIQSLINVRLLEKNRGLNYTVHDWEEHAGHIIYYKQRAKSAASARWAKSVDASSNAPSIDASSNALTLHSIPLQKEERERDEAEQSNKIPASSTPGSLSSSHECKTTTVSLESIDLQAVLDAFGSYRRGKKADIMKAWKQMENLPAEDRPTVEIILAGITRYRQSQDWKDGVILLFPHWLNQEGWMHEWPPADPTKYCQHAIDGHLCLKEAHQIDRQRFNLAPGLKSMCKPHWDDWSKTAPNHGRRISC